MPGFGPRAGSQADAAPPVVDRDAAASLYAQVFAEGQRSVTQGGYQAGHDLGYDVGSGVRNDAGRGFVRGVIEGHEQGLQVRQELAAAAERGLRAQQARDAHARIEARQAEAELEAEAG